MEQIGKMIAQSVRVKQLLYVYPQYLDVSWSEWAVKGFSKCVIKPVNNQCDQF